MKSEKITSENYIKLHKVSSGYVAEVYVKEKTGKSNSKGDNIELILVVDRSGSMGQNYTKIFKQIVPMLLDKISYPSGKEVHFITFDSSTEYRKINKEGFMNPKNENARGCTYMEGVFNELQKIIIDPTLSYRILSLSDGDLHDSEKTSKRASEFYESIKGKFNINSQAIRFFSSSYANPDTMGLASMLQLNSMIQCKLLDINANDEISNIVKQLSELFINDGLGKKITMKSDKPNLRGAPWDLKKDEIGLVPGRNIVWIDGLSDLKIIYDDDEPMEIKSEEGEVLNTENYGIILADKVPEFITKLKILKILGNTKAQEEITNMINCFKTFEDSLQKIDEDLVLKDGKMHSRIQYIKKLISKRKGLISNQMDAINNENKLDQLNSQQKADYLRNVDLTKIGRSLGKRAAAKGLDFDATIKKEIKAMNQNLSELKDIDSTDDPISFYSTSSTVEGIKALCEIIDDPVFDQMEAKDFLEIINIVGVASLGTIADYPDPLLYVPRALYPGCYISVSDIVTAEVVSKKEKKLEVPGLKEEINNCIPIFTNEKVYFFMRKYAPSILELTAGIGMRRVLAEIPKTLEATVLSGLTKMAGILKGNEKLEVNIRTFLDLMKTVKIVAGNHNSDVIEVMQNQFKDKNCDKLGLYLNSYGLSQLLPVMIKLSAQNILSKEELQKFLRAVYRFEVYKMFRKNIRKSDDQKKYIDKTLNELLGIDFEKFGTKLPKMFEKNEKPEFCENYILDANKIAEFRKQIGWIENICYMYTLFECGQKQDALNEIKKLPEFDEEKKKELLGIKYDFNKFILFNIIQSLIYTEKSDRENDLDNVMKIMDSNDETEVDKFLKGQTKHIYAAQYNIENQKQIKSEHEVITKELVDNLINAEKMEDFNNFLKNGITKGYLSHQIKDESSKGYNDLKNALLNIDKNVPLRFEKIRNLISAIDEGGNVLWNGGNAIRNKRKHYQKFIEKNKPELWKEIKDINIDHNYRQKENRQGHSNNKKSYWAKGFDTLDLFIKTNDEDTVKKYKEVHTNCCGLAKDGKSLKDEKKRIRKEKRKKYKKQS